MGTHTSEVSDGSFNSDVLQAGTPVLVDFWAEWCGPCRALAPKLEELAAEMSGKLKVVKLNVDDNPSTPAQYGVRGIPTLILFKNGKELEQIVGNVPKERIVEAVAKHL